MDQWACLRDSRGRGERISLVRYAEDLGTLIIEEETVDDSEWNQVNGWSEWCLQDVEAGSPRSPR
jgi:hypothetical protein